MQEILGYMRKAITDYNMIEDGDRIAIGVSGGKDSLILMHGLSRLRGILPVKFEIAVITLDPQFDGEDGNYTSIEGYCSENGIPFILRRTDLWHTIFVSRAEKNPCSLCARMRRGILHDITVENGCNKIALGHHRDDAVITLFMNLFNEGRIGCFQPMTYLSRKDITMIRPLVYLEERIIRNTVNRLGIEVVKSKCPADGVTERKEVGELIKSLEKTKYEGLSKKVFGAIKRSHIDNW